MADPRQAVDMWAGRPPNEDSLIIMRGRLGCVTYYARDYARDYARAPWNWGFELHFNEKHAFQYYARRSGLHNLLCAGLVAGLCAASNWGLGMHS